MPGRGSANGYKYGFNGKENDNEIVGTGEGTQDYGMRIYNPALCRFLSVDPLTDKYPFYTPYQFAGNMPIQFIDLDGAEPSVPTNQTTPTNSTPAPPPPSATPVNSDDSRVKASPALVSGQNGTATNTTVTPTITAVTPAMAREYEANRAAANYLSWYNRQDFTGQYVANDPLIREAAVWVGTAGLLKGAGSLMTKIPSINLFPQLTTSTKIFYSGGTIARAEALKFAEFSGYKIIDKTLMGRGLTSLTNMTSYRVTKPLWSGASFLYSLGTRNAVVFVNRAKLSPSSIFLNVELPSLRLQSSNLYYRYLVK